MLSTTSINIIAQTPKLISSKTGYKGFFTDLTKFDSTLICVFREAKTHTSRDGKIAVIRLIKGSDWKWNKIATIEIPFVDLRDPKIIQNSDQKLMLLATGVYPETEISDNEVIKKYQSFYWESDDGLIWKYKGKVSEQDLWLWSLHKNESGIYSISYSVGKKSTRQGRKVRLHKFNDEKFDILTELKHPLLENEFQPSEAAITTLQNGNMVIVIRRKRGLNSVLGTSKPPYTDWSFSELPISIEGQALITIKNKTILAGRDLKDNKKKLSMMVLQLEKPYIEQKYRVSPSKGDFAYPGLEFFNNHLCMSYYKNGKIYFIATKTPLEE